jgi:hypothetical protein
MKGKQRWLAVLVVAGAFALAPGAAQAAVTCNGSPTGTLAGPVTVPNGATCNLNGVTVNGNVTVQPGGTLNANNTRINGNLASNGGSVFFSCGWISGSVTIQNAPYAGGNDSVSIRDTEIGGAVKLLTNSGDVTFDGNTVGGATTVSGNCGDVEITDNTFRGSLAVTNNRKVTVRCNTIAGAFSAFNNDCFNEGGNTVSGARSGQAAAS